MPAPSLMTSSAWPAACHAAKPFVMPMPISIVGARVTTS